MANMPLSNSGVPIPVKPTGDIDPEMSSRRNLGSGGTRQFATFQSAGHYRTGNNFSQLKLTAEKMMQEEACMRSELNILRSKFLKSEEEVRNLESKVLDMNSEIAVLKVDHNEDVKLWKGLDSKLLAASTFSDHLAETLRLLESQLKEAEQSKKLLEEKLAEREKFYGDTKSHVHDMSVKIKTAEDSIKKYEAKIANLSDTLQQQTTTLAAETAKSKKLSSENDGLQQQLSKAVRGRQEDKEVIGSKTAEIQLLTKNLLSKAEDVTNLQNKNLAIVRAKGELEFHLKDLQNSLNLSRKDNETLQEKIEMLNLKISELQKTSAVTTCTIENLHSERVRWAEQTEEDKKEQQRRVNELTRRLSESEKYVELTRQTLREKTQEIETLLKKVAESGAELETARHEVIRMRQECCEKQQLIEQTSQQEQDLRREIQEMRGNWTAAENAAKELNVRFKHQLEAKQAELTIHLQEISLRNNQEMADMRRRYEDQTREVAAEEKRKGEATVEAIRKASERELSRELDAANQRLKGAERDHEDMVRLIKQAGEEEKEKMVALHAEELLTKQQELRVEMEKRCAHVAALEHQNEELKKFQQEEMTKLQATSDMLLETAQETDLLKDQMKKLKEDHKVELANKIQDHNAKCDLLSREQEAEILRLESSSTRKIEEWKSKAVFWQIEFIKLRTSSRGAVEVQKEGARTSSTPLNKAEDVSTYEGASGAKVNKCVESSENSRNNDDHRLNGAELAENSQNNDLTVSRTLPSATSVVPRDHELKSADAVQSSHNINATQSRTIPSADSFFQRWQNNEATRADAIVAKSYENKDVKLSRTMPSEDSYDQRDHELDRVRSGRNSKDKDGNPLKRMTSVHSLIQGEISANGYHIHRELSCKKNEVILASSSHSAKEFDGKCQMQREQKQEVNESAVITRNHSGKKAQLRGDPERLTDLDNSEGKEVIQKESRRTKKVAEFPLIRSSSEGKGTVVTRRKTGSRVSGQDRDKMNTSKSCLHTSVDNLRRKPKRVKFNENQQSEVISKTLCDLFKMEELMDPYDGPYVFNE